ncbi:MAG: hypothetical protein K2Z25_19305 [Beijerinckiaceae bacterium]|nr:hypothetical protein [Beijerinckiaceae bacterium]
MSRLNPDQYHDGHRLPFRVEVQLTAVGIAFIVLDADHLDVPVFVHSLEDMLRYVDEANELCTHYSARRGITMRGAKHLSTPYRLDDSHPADRLPPTLATAFECLVIGGAYRDWITPALIDDLRGFKLVDANGVVPKKLVDRWIAWRKAEDAELVRLGIHAAPTPVIQAFRTASRSHLTVVQ